MLTDERNFITVAFILRSEITSIKKVFFLSTILKSSIRLWIPAFAGMTNKDGTDLKNVPFPRKRESSIVNNFIRVFNWKSSDNQIKVLLISFKPILSKVL